MGENRGTFYMILVAMATDEACNHPWIQYTTFQMSKKERPHSQKPSWGRPVGHVQPGVQCPRCNWWLGGAPPHTPTHPHLLLPGDCRLLHQHIHSQHGSDWFYGLGYLRRQKKLMVCWWGQDNLNPINWMFRCQSSVWLSDTVSP